MYQKITMPIFFCLFLSLSFSACKEPVEIESTITPMSLHFSAAGGQDKFLVSVKSPATVESIEALDQWCRVFPYTSFADMESPINVIVIVDSNNGAARNTSVVVHLKSGKSRLSTTVQISQARTEIEYTVMPTNFNFNAIGGQDEFTVSVKSPATIESIEALDAWCQVSVNGDSLVNVIVTVDPNNTGEVRQTSVVVNMKLRGSTMSATVHISQDPWVLISGIKWAICNLDAPGTFATHPEASGMFYQWNRKTGWSASNPLINSDGGTTWDSSDIEGDAWEKANDPCPPGWRVPTIAELQSLSVVTNKWTTINGVDGRIYGSDNDLLFLSAVGYRVNGALYYVGIYGLYWSSTANYFNYAHGLSLERDGTGPYSSARTYGASVRCVAE